MNAICEPSGAQRRLPGDRWTRVSLHELRQVGVACRVDPVQVVDQQNRQLPLAPGLHEAPQEAGDLTLARFGVHLRRTPLRVGNAEEVEHDREGLAKRFVQQQQAPDDLLSSGLIPVLCGDPEGVAE